MPFQCLVCVYCDLADLRVSRVLEGIKSLSGLLTRLAGTAAMFILGRRSVKHLGLNEW